MATKSEAACAAGGSHSEAEQARRDEQWLIGFRIGLAVAEGASEVLRRAGRIDVLDDGGKVISSSRIDQLLM